MQVVNQTSRMQYTEHETLWVRYCGGRNLDRPVGEVMCSFVCCSFECYFSSGIFQCYQYGIRGKQGVGRCRLVVMYLPRSGEGSVIYRLRGDDVAMVTRRDEKQEAGQDKNRRLGSGQVSIKGPAFSPLLPLFLFSRHEVGFLLLLLALLSTIRKPFSPRTEIGRTGRSSVEAKIGITNPTSLEVVIRTENVLLGVVGR